MKNLIIIHLESLNNAFLYQNSEMFPNILKLKEKSLFFSNYYSTATSTIMTMADLMYENDSFSDKTTGLEELQLMCKQSLWIEGLGVKYSQKKAVIYPELDWKYDRINMKKIMGKTSKLIEKTNYADFKKEISNTIKEMDGDYTYIYDWSTLYIKDDCENKYSCWNEYYFKQYKRIDETVGYVFEQVKLYKKLKETMFLLFGDHGDDMYSYGKNKGFTHAIAPYPNIIRTPLMLYYDGIDAQINENLVCTFDVGKIVKSIYEKNDVKVNRQYVFSRNLFPLQKSKVLQKSYAVADGEYLLLISSKGLELYMCKFMSHSIFNLLNWFVLKRCGELEIKMVEKMHFKRMIYDQKEDIKQHFYKLRKLLYKELKKKADAGLLQKNIKWWFTRIHYNSAE